MKIIIVGAGEVGFNIAQRLASEDKEVVVIDRSPEQLKQLSEVLDVQVVQGSGSSPGILEDAGIAGAEILLAVTDSDDTNLIACLFANFLAPGVIKVARIRDEKYSNYQHLLEKDILKISLVINPEVEVVKTIQRLMSVPGAVDIGEFAQGRVKLIGIKVAGESPLAGTRLLELRQKIGETGLVIGAIIRENRLIVPTGRNRLEAGDLVYFVCEKEHLDHVLNIFGQYPKPIRDVMIIGGGHIGRRLAATLEKEAVRAKLIEKDSVCCHSLSERLNHTLIIHGDGTDQELLEQENIGEMDLVITVTEDEETNVLASLLAKRLGAERTITRINKFAYVPLVEAIGLDHIVSPRLSAIDTILQYIRRGKVITTLSLKGEEVEVLEAVALETSDLVSKPLKNLRFPTGIIVLAILRGDKVIVPTGESIVLPQDRVIIISSRKNMPWVEKALMVNLEYF
ncbi:MAG: Trk system potassium transporter TrkA [Deltaproteobacteria bacterium]|nr:MAG: Trk system potassium transporter TrkA [Deltaproteobacteria bacterium]